MNNKNKGFTLIEMLIVIAIIAILSAIVLTSVSGFQASARDTARVGNLKNIQSYLELFYNKCGYYPGYQGGNSTCNATLQQWSDLSSLMSTVGVTNQLPKDPSAGRSFCYGVNPNDGNSYILGTVLESSNSVLNDNGAGPSSTGGITSLQIPGIPPCGGSNSATTYWINS